MAELHNNYPIETGSETSTYDFISEGKNGRIRKRVEFYPFQSYPNTFNLALGDVNELEEIDDKVISDNGDTIMVLSTVAACVELFFEQHPYAIVYATGSGGEDKSRLRNRLYRMGITGNLSTIENRYDVFGRVKKEEWEHFKTGRDRANASKIVRLNKKGEIY